jgi:hypothetical protein
MSTLRPDAEASPPTDAERERFERAWTYSQQAVADMPETTASTGPDRRAQPGEQAPQA